MEQTHLQLIDYHLELKVTAIGDVIKEKYPISLGKPFRLHGYRAQAHLAQLDAAGTNRFWLHALESGGYQRFGGSQGHDLLVFLEDTAIQPLDRVVRLQTPNPVNGLECEIEVKAKTAENIHISLELLVDLEG